MQEGLRSPRRGYPPQIETLAVMEPAAEDGRSPGARARLDVDANPGPVRDGEDRHIAGVGKVECEIAARVAELGLAGGAVLDDHSLRSEVEVAAQNIPQPVPPGHISATREGRLEPLRAPDFTVRERALRSHRPI